MFCQQLIRCFLPSRFTASRFRGSTWSTFSVVNVTNRPPRAAVSRRRPSFSGRCLSRHEYRLPAARDGLSVAVASRCTSSGAAYTVTSFLYCCARELYNSVCSANRDFTVHYSQITKQKDSRRWLAPCGVSGGGCDASWLSAAEAWRDVVVGGGGGATGAALLKVYTHRQLLLPFCRFLLRRVAPPISVIVASTTDDILIMR